ncbi:MAG: phosphoribosylamine--glycine ligase [Candidatus Thorarchaeota archaeon]|nr:phosphoribosylamine--glycine ligase [Candidatus Thorarchaeota archaeon]
MTRVLLVGNGAREHALATALHRSDVEIVSRMSRNNPGIARLSKEVLIGPLEDFGSYLDLSGIDYAVIGPEAPLALGVVDYLEQHGVPCVGPSKEPAQIETSKVFARTLLDDVAPHANPEFGIARSPSEIDDIITQIGQANIVIKPDGLTGGKGVKIFGEHLHSIDDIKNYAEGLIAKEGAVLLEERLQGIEFTMQTFVDGERLELMPLVRDYKRAFDGDQGPNTGSMGSYSQADHRLAYLEESDIDAALGIMRTTVRGLKERTGARYKGILYGQFMKTKSGVKVIEFNARFGDPEAMNVLTLLSSSMDDVCQSIVDGHVVRPTFEHLSTVCVYVVPEGYPGPDVVKDAEITIGQGLSSHIYYASVYEKDSQVYTTGSRALGVLATAPTVAEARAQAYADVQKIAGRVRFRSDIADGIDV